MRALLIAPLGLQVPGNGMAQRAAMWAEVLRDQDHEPTVVVVPVAGPATDDGSELVLLPARREREDVPALARGVDRRTGRLAGVHVRTTMGIDAVDVIVCLRSYLGRAALGLRDVLGGALVLDLDDDDVAFFTRAGDAEQATRFARLIHALRPEADLVVSAGGTPDTTTVPNSVRPPDPPTRRAEAASVVMVANMGYAPNREGAQWFLDAVLPRLRATEPDVAVRIAGPGSEQFAPAGLGFVEDLPALYADAAVVVAPLLVGSGTRTKIIEAWAHGAPVVSTTVGAEGLGGVDGEHLLLADEPQAFAAAVSSLRRDPERASRLGHAGRSLVHERYDRARVVADARAHLDSLRPCTVVARAPELHVVETEEGLIVLDIPSGDVHELDPGAASVFTLVENATDVDELAGELAELFGLPSPPHDLVHDAVQHLLTAGLLERTRRAPVA